MSDSSAASPPLDGPDSAPASLTDLLRRRAAVLPAKRLFTFLADGEHDALHLTYQDLDRRACALAAKLQELGLAGERAVLLYPPGLDFLTAFFGCLAAGVVAVPASLPRINRPMTRLRSIVVDARPRILLTTSAQWVDADRWAEGVPELAGLARLATDQVDASGADGWHDPAVGADTLAFLQYTSGSTAAPKGVMISHGNLLHNSALIRECFASSSDSRGVFWLPLFHDMGLIGGVVQTIYCGGSSTLLPPVAFLQRPLRWLQAVSRTGATISGGPNFAYDLCVRKITPAQRDGLDLSRWRVAFNGAEPVRAETLDRFADFFAPCGFRRDAFLPCYGLAEGTLLVSGARSAARPVVRRFRPEALDCNLAHEAPEGRALVGSGQAATGLDVAIVDPETGQRRPDCAVGEIWVRGLSVADGYWARIEASEETFHARLSATGDGPYLRTGDLGFLCDGELFVTGRLKDLIIVRGRNLYPQDIEETVERAHPSLVPGGGAAFAVEADGAERLVVVQECERIPRGQSAEPILDAIRQAVAEQHELDVHAIRLIRPLTLPKTSSGKVQRHQCRQAYLDDSLETVAGWIQQPQEYGPVVVESARPLATTADAATIARWLAARVGASLGRSPDDIDVRRPFAGFGLGSLQAVQLAADLGAWLDRSLSPTLAYEYPTIEALAQHLAREEVSAADQLAGNVYHEMREPIAIVGIGCRFPGARGPEEFWNLVRSGRDAVGSPPVGRGWDDEDGAVRGGFLDEIETFDADFFGITPREALRMDPQQRILMEVAWEALEDAGIVSERLAGKAVGVFIGVSTHDYDRLPWDEHDAGDAYLLTGNAASVAANRISYAFDLRGPSLAIDTACSSSLVAVHTACQSLRAGESTLALAGGVNLMLAPEVSAQFARAGFLAADGRCKTFDAGADGYVRGEGCGVVVLKPLSRALADEDSIYAVIRGSAVNQDGRTNGLTAPNQHAQEAVLRAAYQRAGVEPGSVGLIEAHGTGTLLGDPIEARALASVLTHGRAPGRLAALGSVKTNIGHLEAAAGVAGLIKTALALSHAQVPASLNYREPNPHIAFDSAPFFVPGEVIPLPEAPVFAGVSAFGFGGTNAHVVLERAPRQRVADGAATRAPSVQSSSPVRLLPISARSEVALLAAARVFRERLNARDDWGDVVHSASTRRDHHDHRLAIIATDEAHAVEQIDSLLLSTPSTPVLHGRRPATGRPKLAFVFTGQGAHWTGAGRALLESEPVFRAVIEACEPTVVREGGWSLLAELNADESVSRLAETAFGQPALFALQAGLTALWNAWGIVPDAVVGHSVGELAAAYAAGALSLEEGIRTALLRGRLMQRVAGHGKTAAVGLGVDEIRSRVGDAIAIAAVNGPRSTTVSGPGEAIDALVEELSKKNIFARVLAVPCAFHGPQMEPLRGELIAGLRDLHPQEPTIRMISTVTGGPIEGLSLDAEYWGRNLRDPVLFASAVKTLASDEHTHFVEIGPHPALGLSIADTLRERGQAATVIASLRRGEDAREVLLRGAGTLYTAGFDLSWARIAPSGQHVRLLSYPWQRSRFWPDFTATSASAGRNGRSHANGHVGQNGTYQHGKQPPTTPDSSARADQNEIGRLLYRVVWQPEPRPASVAPLDAELRACSWLIVGNGGALGAALVARLLNAGAKVEHSHDDERFASDERPDARWRVVDLRTLNEEPSGLVRSEAVATDDVADACARVASLVASLPDSGRVRLFVVTRGAQAVLEGESPSLTQAPLWGLGKVASLEYPRVWGGMIDLAREPGEAQVEALLARFVVAAGEDQYAYRGESWFVPRLEPAPKLGRRDDHLTIRPEGTYLITGGLGDLGLTVARWLVERGARRLVLLGRRGLPPRSRWDTLAEGDLARARVAAIRSLEERGATVITFAADASDRTAMAALCDQLAQTFPPIRGVVHAAGVVEPKALGVLDRDALLATLRPKVAGTLVLDELTRGLPLDFFVLFSSVSSVWGSARLGDYAAANAFLDAFATARRAEGVPVTSVNWGPWAEVGMAASPDWERSLALMGLRALKNDDALEAIDRIAAGAAAQATVADVDWHTFRALHAQHGRRHFLDAISAESAAQPSLSHHGAVRGEWLALPPDERRERLLHFVRTQVARVMGHAPDRVDVERALGDMGLDSLMAMELRGAIEHELGTVVPLSTFLEGPSVVQLVERVLAQWSDGESSGVALTPAAIAAVSHPLAPNQQSMWFLHQTTSVGAAYQIAGAARIRSAIDTDALRRGLTRLAERHEALRSNVRVDDGLPVVRIRQAPDVDFRVENVEGVEPSDVQHRLSLEARRPFDLQHDPLLRVVVYRRADDEFDVLMVIHHIISDFWSIAVLIDELGQFYAQELSGRIAALPPLALRYSDFVRWQSETLAGAEGERLWDYWRQRLDGPLPELNLPTDRPRPSVQTQNGASRFHHLDRTLSDRITALCEAESASPYTVLLAAFQILLGRYSGQEDVIVGSPVAGRTRPGLDGLIGYFVNLLPMRSDLSNNPPFVDFLRQVRQTVHGALEHQDFPLPLMIQRLQPDRDPSRSPIFQAMFIYQKAQRLDDQGLTPFSLFEDGPQLALSGLTLESIALDKHTSLFDLTLTAARMDGRYSLALEFNTDLFDAATAERLLGHLETLLMGIVAQPEMPIGDLSLASALEHRRVLEDWCSPRAAANAEECVHDRVARIARAQPDAIAVALGAERLTYRALEAQTRRLASRLAAQGVGPNVLVALCIERSPTLLVSLLGVLEAGGAYVPLDPSYPDARLRDVLAEARPALLLVRRADAARFAGCGVPLLYADEVDDAPLAPPALRATLADLAYVVYTSGSTGTPKGVMVTHANLANTWSAWAQAYELDDRPARHLQMAGPAFDVFTGDWVRALASGGTLVICPREVMLDPEALERLLRDERIECAEFVPAVAGPLLEHLERSGTRLDALRLVVIGSDLWLAGQHERLRRFCGAAVRVVNSYGLTETTIDSTYFEGSLGAQAPDRAAPIGRPFAGTRLYVLDGRGALAATGVPGELFIGGAGVARGYLHNPSLTAERFVPDPFASVPGARMYRTGDVVRWRDDGTLEFLGRRDEQVKIRGYRIEPGEVEGTLARHPSIRAAVVAVRGDAPAARRLVAYVVHQPADAFDPAELRRWLQERLPEPMIPAVFVQMDALPLSPNGKVDRRALPAPPSASADAIETPRSAIEETLVRVIGGLLGHDRVGIHDDLFALGMDSILVIQAVTRARREGLRLDPAQLFRHSTVAALAEVVAVSPASESSVSLGHPLERVWLARLLAEEPAVEDAYPLSPVQEGMLFHDAASAPGSGVYVEQVVCALAGPLDLGAFERAWKQLVARHAALRTAIQRDAGRSLQVVYRHTEPPLEVLDWRGIEANEQAERFETLLRDDRARGFVLSWAPLARTTLVRLADDRAKLVWTLHHIVVDGWCIPLLLQELLALYESPGADLPRPRPYRDYIAWLSQRDLAAAEAFWQRTLEGYYSPVSLELTAPSNGRPAVTECEANLPEATTTSLRDVARTQQLTLNTLVQGAWALLLSRYSGRTDIVFGVAVSGRPAELEGVESMIGMFINTLPLRVAVDEDALTSDWLRTVQERQVALSRFEFSPLVQVQGWSAVPRGKPLFESVVVFQNTPLDAGVLDRASELGVAGVRVLGQTNYPLTLTVIPGPELTLSLGFDPARFEVHAVQRVLGHLICLLEAMAADPERPLADLSMLTDADRALVLADEATPSVQDDLLPDLEQLSDEELDQYLERLQADGGVER